MKFRAISTDAAAMKDFMTIVTSFSKLAKECVMRIEKLKVYFIISEESSGPRRPSVWCELPASYYFKEYNLSGVSEKYDEIYLSLSAGLLARSLSALKQNAKSLKIRLTNKQTPCLTLEIDFVCNEAMQNCQLTHDIPVDIVSPKCWSDYEEPQFNDFHVSIQMPNLKLIKTIVEHMKTMSQSLIVSANKNGRLTLKIKSTMVSLSAHFPDLSVESFAVEGIPEGEDEQMEFDHIHEFQTVTATVDIKKFLMFLAGMHTNHYHTTCSIVQGQMVKLALEQPGVVSLQCFLTELII